MSKEKQIEFEMAEMLEIIENAREVYANDVTDHTENEYIREGLLNACYRKQSEGEWKEDIIAFCNVCSACKAKVDRYAIKCNSGKLNFCPNCGAKMRKEDEGK